MDVVVRNPFRRLDLFLLQFGHHPAMGQHVCLGLLAVGFDPVVLLLGRQDLRYGTGTVEGAGGRGG